MHGSKTQKCSNSEMHELDCGRCTKCFNNTLRVVVASLIRSQFSSCSYPLISNTQSWSCQELFSTPSSPLFILYNQNISALSTPIISYQCWWGIETWKEMVETEKHSWVERPVESEVKEALDQSLRALVHHFITSAACVCFQISHRAFPLARACCDMFVCL